MDKLSFGKRVAQARKQQNITAEQLSNMCDHNAVFLRQIESGVRLPSLPTFIEICNALAVSPDRLLQDQLVRNDLDMLEGIAKKAAHLSPRDLKKLDAMIDTLFSE
ncbi:hypothetical protein CE91St44_33210 [Oscillospiraceae bacterium]|uniref:helix-turn-helix domain-containing protein n=1 Tax=Allofournierella sp. TaxID=1940256 RepID=UPI0015AD5326|nr:hypothetical protein CE91St44_33210 [Oscillospiraceae bacterium]